MVWWQRTIGTGLLTVALVNPVFAQTAPAAKVDVDKLPIDLHRIERILRQPAVREEHDVLRLRFTVDVYGQAPRLQLFTREDNLTFGRAPYGAPTHREMVDVATPKEYRAPVADFSALMRWIQQKVR